MVEDFLSHRGVAFEKKDVSQNSSYAQELVRITGQMGVPATIIDGQTVIGFDRQRLEQILSQATPSFGASIADAARITVKQGSALTPGVYIGRVKPGSAAERAGLMAGDIITELNRRPMTSASDFEQALSSLKKGEHLSLVFLRSGKTLTAEGVL
jgi:S1-C subfamily serine protease